MDILKDLTNIMRGKRNERQEIAMTDKIIVEKIQTIDSTNLELKRRVKTGDFSSNVLIADEQTAGRGRLGRTFESPDKTGLYMSLLIKVDFNTEETILITSAAAVAVARAIRNQTGREALIKWVNDIYIDNKKVCGILAEAVTSPDNETYIILGIGVNISTTKENFSSEVSQIAGSLYSETSMTARQIELIKNELADKIINEFYGIYDNLSERTFLDDYRRWSLVIGKEVRFFMNEVWQNGKAVDIDDNGALLVETDSDSNEDKNDEDSKDNSKDNSRDNSEKMIVKLNTGEITLRLQD